MVNKLEQRKLRFQRLTRQRAEGALGFKYCTVVISSGRVQVWRTLARNTVSSNIHEYHAKLCTVIKMSIVEDADLPKALVRSLATW